MGAKPKRPKDAIANSLFDLLQSCPFDHRDPEDCPLYALRKLSPARGRAWLKSLTEEELTYLASYHHVCLAIKNGVVSGG